jgi:hypothetical protein
LKDKETHTTTANASKEAKTLEFYRILQKIGGDEGTAHL